MKPLSTNPLRYPEPGIGNELELEPGRQIDYARPVNVTLPRAGALHDVWQHGVLVARAQRLMLNNATCHPAEHPPYIQGKIANAGGMGTTATSSENTHRTLPARIEYNPLTRQFECSNLTARPFVVSGAMCVAFNLLGAHAAYTE